MSVNLRYTAPQLAERCNNDPEFRLSGRYWNGGLQLDIGDQTLSFNIEDGVVSAGPLKGLDTDVTLSGDENLWEPFLTAKPPRFMNDLAPLTVLGVDYSGSNITLAQYYGAINRLFELLRPEVKNERDQVSEPCENNRIDAPVGRYIHLDIDGYDYRIYFEEAGQGIPLLLQHTAGGHGSQWRHLFENTAITDRFRLISYDLPFHGKSIPPIGKRWWEEEYKLKGTFLRQLPIKLAKALDLDRPAFMGCSVGGVLALDLAYHHPDEFRSVISLEGSLRIASEEDDETMFVYLSHPQVSNEYKSRLMYGLTGPSAPEPYRRETIQVYGSGWTAAFLGDLEYYNHEFNLEDVAGRIDTSKVGVHILSGEYDYSGTMEMGEEAHETIKGSTWSVMDDMGHFPMSEDPERFMEHLLPILDSIAKTGK